MVPSGKLFEILRIFAGRIVLVRRAGEKLPISPPLDLHHPAALFARNVRRRLHRVFGPWNGLRPFQFPRERRVKIAHRRNPRFIALFDFIQLFFHVRGEVDIDEVGKALQQKIVHGPPGFRGTKRPSVFSAYLRS